MSTKKKNMDGVLNILKNKNVYK